MGSSIATDVGNLGHAGVKPLLLAMSLLFLAACAPITKIQPAMIVGDGATARLDGPEQTAAMTPGTQTDNMDPLIGKSAALIGIAAGDLEAQLGKPARIRIEEPVQIYQYVGSECVLDLYLYAGERGYRVSYVEARDSGARRLSADHCLKSIGLAHIASIGS